MQRRGLAALVILGACSGPSQDATPKVAPKPVRHTAPTVIRGAHSATIEIVAVGDDGTVAATQDAMGGTRLWPALDGSAEPIVVRMAAGRELVVGRTNSGFAAATLDDAGTIDMVELAGDGTTRSRKQITGDAIAEDIAMTPAGLLALRADQTLVLFAPNGVERSRLVPPPGERIASVIARNGHAIALIKGAKLHARTITLEPIGWGAESAALSLATKRVVLAPNGKRIAAATDKGGVAVTELATGATVTTVCKPDSAKGAPIPPTELDGVEVPDFVTRFQVNNTAAIGFTGDSDVVCFVGGRIETWSTAGKLVRIGGIKAAAVPELVGIANGLVVTADNESLALDAHGTTQYLGYGLANPSMVRTGPAGITLGHGHQPLLVDHTLKAKRRLDLPVDASELDDVLPLDALHVLVSRSDTSGDAIVHHVKLLDLAMHRSQALEYTPHSYELRYEPSTHLLGLADKRGAWLVPLDAMTWTFGAGYHLVSSAKDVHLVDPTLSDGLTAIGVRAEHDRTYVDEFAARDLTHDNVIAPRHSYEVFGDPVAVDRAGRVYVADGDTITVYTSGERDNATKVAQWKQLGRAVVRPSPDATQLLVLGDNRVRMLDAKGTQLWVIPAATAIDVAWVDGEPFARFAAGLAKLDLASGALLERACGWSFGLSPLPFEVAGDSQSVCDAL